MYVVWAVAIIAFGIFEGITAQLVSIWFVLGSVAALIATFCGAPIWLQAVIFVIVSAVSMAGTRPFVRKYLHGKIEKTNADRCIGQEAIVIEEINNLLSTGLVKTDGKVWTARSSEQDAVIPKDSIVIVDRIEGVKVIVSPK